jgi:hypothetical protein
MQQAKITRLLFVPTGAYHDMALRPYTFRANGNDLQTLERATDGFRNLTTGALGTVAGSLLRPHTTDVGTVSIANGWNSQRYMYMMEVVYPNESVYADTDNVAVKVKYITGMTDRVGDPSFSGHIDPAMMMFIDKVIDTNEVKTGYGIRRRPVTIERYIPANVGQQRRGQEGFYSMRPRDVCSAIGNSGIGGYVDMDYRTSMSIAPITSHIFNDLPTNYLSRTFNAYRKVTHDVKIDPLNTDKAQLMYDVAGSTSDKGAISDEFIVELTRNTELYQGSSYSYGELCRMFRGTEENTLLVDTGSMVRDIGFGQHNPRDTEHWYGSNNETVIATIMAQSVQALMVGSLLTQAAFTVTNDTVDGLPQFEWQSVPQSFIQTDASLEEAANYFQDRLMSEVFPSLTQNGNLSLTLGVHSDLVASDTRIDVVYEGGPMTPYCMPSFAGSLITPVVANNRSQLDNLAVAFNDVFDHMASGIAQPQPLSAPYNKGGFQVNDTNLGAAIRQRTQSTASGGFEI